MQAYSSEVTTIEMSYRFSCFGIWEWVIIDATSEAMADILILRGIIIEPLWTVWYVQAKSILI